MCIRDRVKPEILEKPAPEVVAVWIDLETGPEDILRESLVAESATALETGARFKDDLMDLDNMMNDNEEIDLKYCEIVNTSMKMMKVDRFYMNNQKFQ